MSNSTFHKYLVAAFVVCFLVFSSCRKKDEKYDGIYTGTEHFTIHDSSGTEYTVDSTYYQEFHVNYSARKKYYSVTKLYDPHGGQTIIHKNDIVDHEYYPFGEIWDDSEGNTYGFSAYFNFAGDSLYFRSTSSVNWEFTQYEFHGKKI